MAVCQLMTSPVPRQPGLKVGNDLIIYTLVRLISKWFLGFLGKPVIAGEENIRRTGPVIVVANHTSLLDGFLLAVFLAAANYVLVSSLSVQVAGSGSVFTRYRCHPGAKRRDYHDRG